MPTYDTKQMLEEWRINGFVVFEQLIPAATIDAIRQAWIPIRQADIERQGPNPPRGRGRYNVRVPFVRPFVDPDIFEHPALVPFVEGVLGADYVWPHFDSNIPLPGTDYQNWHRDVGLPFPGLMTSAFTIGIKFPLVDTDEENGSIEILPGTQYLADADLQGQLDKVLGEGEQTRGRYASIRLNLKKGDLWIHDARIIHRGTPNRSQAPRDELCMAMCAPWFFNQWQHDFTAKHFPRDLWENLPEHGRHVLRRQRVKDR